MGGYRALPLPVLLAACFLITILGVASGEKLSEYLWQNTASYRDDALKSTYIQGLKAVTLDPTQFGVYMLQDAIYLYEGAKIFEIARDRADAGKVKDFLQKGVDIYMSIYNDFSDEWHIASPSGITLGDAITNYINHLNDVARNKDPIYLVVAMLPCAKMWPWLGAQIDADNGNFGVYNKWVRANLDPTYTEYKEYDDLIDEAYNAGDISKNEALQVFKESMKGEAAFFNSVKAVKQKGTHDEF